MSFICVIITLKDSILESFLSSILVANSREEHPFTTILVGGGNIAIFTQS